MRDLSRVWVTSRQSRSEDENLNAGITSSSAIGATVGTAVVPMDGGQVAQPAGHQAARRSASSGSSAIVCVGAVKYSG